MTLNFSWLKLKILTRDVTLNLTLNLAVNLTLITTLHMTLINHKSSFFWKAFKGTCAYNVCQCDLELAKKFADLAGDWNSDYHAGKFGNFDRESQCVRSGDGGAGGAGSATGYGVEKIPDPLECCGDKFTFPFNKPRHSDQCCVGTQAKPLSQC